jgi:hypothetical protein
MWLASGQNGAKRPMPEVSRRPVSAVMGRSVVMLHIPDGSVTSELADHVDVVRIDEIGSGPAIEVVLGKTLIRELPIGVGDARDVLCGEYFGTDGFVIAAIVALVEFASAAELGNFPRWQIAAPNILL